jgi:hypothetical protein
VLFGEEALEGETGGFLLGLFFCVAFGFREGSGTAEAVAYADFNAEAFLVVGAALGGQDVVGLAGTAGLEMFLKGGFVIANGSREGVAGLQGEVEIGKGGLDDMPLDEGAGGGEAAVKIERGDDGFEGVSEQGWLLAAATLLFSATEEKEVSQADAGGHIAEVVAADERGAEAGEFSFSGGREATEERFGDGETEDGVADELQLLVVGGGIERGFGVGFVCEGSMGECPGEQFGALEGMIEETWGGLARLRSSGSFSARRHLTPLRLMYWKQPVPG